MFFRFFFGVISLFKIDLQCSAEAAELSTLIQLNWFRNCFWPIPMGYRMCTTND